MTAEQPYGIQTSLSYQKHGKTSPTFVGSQVPMGGRSGEQFSASSNLHHRRPFDADSTSADDSGYHLPADDEPDFDSDYGSLDSGI